MSKCVDASHGRKGRGRGYRATQWHRVRGRVTIWRTDSVPYPFHVCPTEHSVLTGAVNLILRAPRR